MCSLLLIYLLSVESSYLSNLERPSSAATGDTVQFCLHLGQGWRIKTFAVDGDVHVWNLGDRQKDEFEKLAHENTQKNYGDVLSRVVRAESSTGLEGLKTSLEFVKLQPLLEVPSDAAFAFWVPVAGVYRTQSSPQ